MKVGVFKEIFWVLFGVFGLCGCVEDELVFRDDTDDNSWVNRTLYAPSTEIRIPEQLLIRMKDVRNTNEFMRDFVSPSSIHIPFASDTPVFGRSGGSGVSQNIAEFASCRPEETVVELDEPEQATIILWPPCVRVRRCGGCCTSKLLECQPVNFSYINVTVALLRYHPQLPKLENEGSRTYVLEQHDSCECSCRQQAHHCNPEVHEYRPEECRCACINQTEALGCTGPKKIWDGGDCTCKCRRVKQCSTGFFFNIVKCRCEVLRNVSRSRVAGIEYRGIVFPSTNDSMLNRTELVY